MRRVCAAVATFMVSSSALAEEPCAKLTEAYNQAGKQASLTWADTIGDSSAPRKTMSNIEINSYLLVKLINLQLLIQNKCPVPGEAALYIEYPSDALACSSAMTKGEKDSPKCSFSTWKRASK